MSCLEGTALAGCITKQQQTTCRSTNLRVHKAARQKAKNSIMGYTIVSAPHQNDNRKYLALESNISNSKLAECTCCATGSICNLKLELNLNYIMKMPR